MHTIKQYVQNALGIIGLHERMRASRIYDWYWTVADKSVIDDRRDERMFYQELLEGFNEGDMIFDIGANHGTKTGIFLSLGARVIAVEPDETNQSILRSKFLKYRFVPKSVLIVPKAVSNRAGVETMWIDHPGSAKNTFSEKWVETLRVDEQRFGNTLQFAQRRDIETTTLEELFEVHGVPVFVKIDVEGYELKVLEGLQRPVPYVSFEVNLPEFREDGLRCVDRLHSISPEGLFNYTSDCRRGLETRNGLPQATSRKF